MQAAWVMPRYPAPSTVSRSTKLTPLVGEARAECGCHHLGRVAPRSSPPSVTLPRAAIGSPAPRRGCPGRTRVFPALDRVFGHRGQAEPEAIDEPLIPDEAAEARTVVLNRQQHPAAPRETSTVTVPDGPAARAALSSRLAVIRRRTTG